MKSSIFVAALVVMSLPLAIGSHDSRINNTLTVRATSSSGSDVGSPCVDADFCKRWMCEHNHNRKAYLLEDVGPEKYEAASAQCDAQQTAAFKPICQFKGKTLDIGYLFDPNQCDQQVPPQLLAVDKLAVKAESRSVLEVGKEKDIVADLMYDLYAPAREAAAVPPTTGAKGLYVDKCMPQPAAALPVPAGTATGECKIYGNSGKVITSSTINCEQCQWQCLTWGTEQSDCHAVSFAGSAQIPRDQLAYGLCPAAVAAANEPLNKDTYGLCVLKQGDAIKNTQMAHCRTCVEQCLSWGDCDTVVFQTRSVPHAQLPGYCECADDGSGGVSQPEDHGHIKAPARPAFKTPSCPASEGPQCLCDNRVARSKCIAEIKASFTDPEHKQSYMRQWDVYFAEYFTYRFYANLKHVYKLAGRTISDAEAILVIGEACNTRFRSSLGCVALNLSPSMSPPLSRRGGSSRSRRRLRERKREPLYRSLHEMTYHPL